MARFFKLTTDMTKNLRQGKLTAAEWRLWSYLVECDPFGDEYIDLPDTLSILEECEISKSTFYLAIAKFQKMGLFDFQDKGFSFRNTGASKKSTEVSPKNRKVVLEIGIESEKSENLSEKSDCTIYKEFKTLSEALPEFSEQERERFENFCKREADLLPEPPRLVTKWILKNLDELLGKYREVNPSAFSSNKQVEKGSEVVNRFKNIDPDIADQLEPLIKQGLENGSVIEISPNWKIGVHQIRLFGGRWVESKNWINSQLPKADIPESITAQLKAVGGLDE